MLAGRVRRTPGLLVVLGLGTAVAVPRPAAAQGTFNTELLGRAGAASGRSAYAAVWGATAPDGTELALLGAATGTEIYDVTEPRTPVLVAEIDGPPSQWREMQTWSHYAYIVTEGTGPQSRGVQIVDLADPRSPRYVGHFDSTFVTAHTIHIADGYAYINGSDNGWRILDLSDPERPRDVGGWNTRYVHDCYVRGNLAYLANINSGGFTILDIGDRAHPSELGFTGYGGAATHNCWTTKDGRHLLTTDETSGGHLRIWDVQNPGRPFEIAEWTAHPTASIHNVVVRGDSAYISYYTEGLQVLDISNPASPQLVGAYDTYPGASGGYSGNWGVYPLARSRNIYLSDIQGGLFVVRMLAGGAPVLDFQVNAPAGRTATPGQANLWFFFDLYNTGGGTRTYDLTASNSAAWPLVVQPAITVPRGAVEAVLVSVQVPAEVPGPARVDVQLCARSRTSGQQACAATRIAVPVVLEDFRAEAVAGGVVMLRWRLARDAGDAGGLVVLRATDGEAFAERARLAFEADFWLDEDVEPGKVHVYRLALATTSGTQVLGETRLVPAGFGRSRLLGASPNPFRPATAVHFELGRGGDAVLAIHDVRGRLVRTLAAAGLGPGPQVLVWDGRDAAGRPAASGTYLYRLRSGAWTARGRMVLAR